MLCIYSYNTRDSLFITGRQWYNVNHLLSIEDTEFFSNLPTDFIRSSPV